MTKIQRALISVTDKNGILEFAQALRDRGISILASGGTAKHLTAGGITVTDIATYTGYPEMLGGRVKTLHPKIHGGLLARRGLDDADLASQAILPIDLVIVNLYPFAEVIAKPDCDLANAVQHIDIGGVALLRAGAKNHAAVSVVVDSADYPRILAELTTHDGIISANTRLMLAQKAFAHTAHYDAIIAQYLSAQLNNPSTDFPETLTLPLRKKQVMRYGENPQQAAAFYAEATPPAWGIATAVQLQGKELSFNNVADTDAALDCVQMFTDSPACVIVKHANPCGVAIAKDILTAYQRAFTTDPTSAFGGIIAFNRTLDAKTAQAIVERQFVEVIIAPAVADAAKTILATKENVRVLICDQGPRETVKEWDFKQVTGGLLVQERDVAVVTAHDLKVVTRRAPSTEEVQDLLFAWKVVKCVKSNAIVYAKDRMTLGIGAGQMSRVFSARIAALKAQEEKIVLRDSVMASEAFFPFADGIEVAASVGVRAIIQPGGSVRDADVIAAADAHDLAMVFTGIRHFRH